MRLGIAYDVGAGPVETVVGIRAQVAWEMRTKKKIGDIANGMATTDLVGLLLEQLRADDQVPDGAVNEKAFAAMLTDVNPTEVQASTPTPPDQVSG